jgi:hypothetical protein
MAAVASAQSALTFAKLSVDAKTLSPAALLALAAYSDHLTRWATTRPKE